jgi:hypothetical protein
MRRYTLNERGRNIFIYFPQCLAVYLIGSSNWVELMVNAVYDWLWR